MQRKQATTGDLTKDAAWNFVTGIPGLGTVVAGVAAVDDVYNLVTEDDPKKKQTAMQDLAMDMVSATPGIGTVSSVFGIMFDALSGNQTSSDFERELMGGDPEADKGPNPDDYNGPPPGSDSGTGGASSSSPADANPVRKKASPTAHARKGLPPMLLLTAEREVPGLRDMASDFAKALRAQGDTVESAEIEGTTHRAIPYQLRDRDSDASKAVHDFLNRHVPVAP